MLELAMDAKLSYNQNYTMLQCALINKHNDIRNHESSLHQMTLIQVAITESHM